VTLSNTVFIDRANHKSAVAAFDGAAKYIRNQRQNVWIFPEGTRSYAPKPDLLPFKKGAFHLAIQAQVPVVPCVCANYSNIFSFQKMKFTSGRIPVKVLKPIPTAGLKAEDVEDLMRTVREQMMQALQELYVQTSTEAKYTNGDTTAPGLKEKSKMAMS
jgi:lysophosphatidate acyltransferase